LGHAQRRLERAPPVRHGVGGRHLQRAGPAALPDGGLRANRRDLVVELQRRLELRVVGSGAVAARAQASPGERGGGGHQRSRDEPRDRGDPAIPHGAAGPAERGRGAPRARPKRGATTARAREGAAGWGVKAAASSYGPTLSLSAIWSGFTQKYTELDPIIRGQQGAYGQQYSSCLDNNQIRASAGLAPNDCSQYVWGSANE